MMTSPDPAILDLRKLRNVPVLTAGWASVHAESAAICLEDCGHPTEVPLRVIVDQDDEQQFTLRRHRVSEKMRRANNDPQVATELGACGIAFLVVREVTGLTAINRSRKGTGFDYWLKQDSPDSLPFDDAARLEVSGILHGTDRELAARTRQKLNQSKPSDATTRLPAYAVVVEFGEPKAQVAGPREVHTR